MVGFPNETNNTGGRGQRPGAMQRNTTTASVNQSRMPGSESPNKKAGAKPEDSLEGRHLSVLERFEFESRLREVVATLV